MGFIRIKPDSTEYRSANGRVNGRAKAALIEDFIRVINRGFDPARVTISYPGDVEFAVIFLRPMEGSEVVKNLDRIAQEARETVVEDGTSIGVPYSFQLVLWAMKDPEAISLGQMVEPEA